MIDMYKCEDKSLDMDKEMMQNIRKNALASCTTNDTLRAKEPGYKPNWHSVKKEGNPTEDGEYLVTYLDQAGNYKTDIKRRQSGEWWADKSIIVAWTEKPQEYPWEDFKKDMNM